MITNEQLKLAKEEFGDRAFERFGFAFMGEGRGFSNPLCNSDVKFYECPLRSLPELYRHDVKFYGTVENAILMWQWRYAGGSNDWQDCNKELSFNLNKEYRRKTSAALPFDLDRAKAGDVVEWIDNDIWHTVVDVKDILNSGIDINFKVPSYENSVFRAKVIGNRLRMKYLPKA